MTAKQNLDQALRVLNNTLGRGTPDKPALELDYYPASGGYVLTLPEKDGIPALPFKMARKYPAPLAFALEYAIEILRFAEKENKTPGNVPPAFANLIEKSRLVESDICDQDSGWFYQWSAAIEKAERAAFEAKETAPAFNPPTMANLPDTAAGIIVEMKKRFPKVALVTTWEADPSFVWDGDGPDPQEEGMTAHDVTVTARAIVNGEIVEGSAHLGGTYDDPDGSKCPEVHGYFPQMVCEAFEELGNQIELANI